MNETLTKIGTVTVGSGGASSVTFSNIPQTYTDLKVVGSVRVSADTSYHYEEVSVNIGSGISYSNITLYTSVSSAPASASTTGTGTAPWGGKVVTSGNTVNTFSNWEIYFPNYSSTNQYKTFSADAVGENNATGSGLELNAGLFSTNSPITNITLGAPIGSFVQYSTFYLYGVKNLSTTYGNSIKATGGTITTDGTYVYHTFNSTGTFTPTTRLSADYLVIAGGGGSSASGAGAGGLRSTVGISGGGASPESQIQLISGTSYSVVVGAGGSGASNGQSTNGSNGNNSSFSNIISIGGGGGISTAGTQLNTGQSGGSGSGGYGGGDGSNNGSSAPGGSGTANQGYAGGSSAPKASSTSSSGGGGGAGSVGATASAVDTAGAGGAGVYLPGFSTGSNTGLQGYYAGGGGGGYYINGSSISGGAGGGGIGSSGNSAGSSGTANTGGGAGGAYSESYKTVAYSGGSGLVIIRYRA
jgi:hypothetical protein